MYSAADPTSVAVLLDVSVVTLNTNVVPEVPVRSLTGLLYKRPALSVAVVPSKLVPPGAIPSKIGSVTRGYECCVALLSRVHVNVRDSFRILISVPADNP